MKVKLIIFSLLLVAQCVAFPQFQTHRREAFRAVPPVGPTFLVNEDFDGSGVAAGWFNSGGNWDYTPPLTGGGTESGHWTSGEYSVLVSGGPLNHTELYGKLSIKIVVFPSSFTTLFSMTDSGWAQSPAAAMHSDGRIEINAIYTTDSMVVGTQYNIYWHYKAGTGANGIVSCAFTTGSTRPTSGTNYVEYNIAGFTLAMAQYFINPGNGAEYIVDNVQIATTAFD